MNKAELVDALTERLGDKKTATAAVDAMVDVVVRAVNKGDKVTITGFGVFEKRARAARTARNPRTGESVKVKKTNVPAFRAGTMFKDVVSGARKLPRATASARPTASTAASSATRGTPAQAASTRSANGRAASGRATTTAPARSTAARATATKSAAERTTKAGTKSTATKTAAAKAPAAKTAKSAAAKPAKASTAKAAAKPAAKAATSKPAAKKVDKKSKK